MTIKSEQLRILGKLWREFVPLSISDVTMACGDPAITTTLSHLPDARLNLGAVGVAKSLAVLFESPIIMLLHASNTLATAAASRRALWHFMILAIIMLTAGMIMLTIETIFFFIGSFVLGLQEPLLGKARSVLLLLMFWPAAIGWRRYYQGLLIRAGEAHWVARAGLLRLLVVFSILAIGFWLALPGATLAGVALITGVIAEACLVTAAGTFAGAKQEPIVQIKSKIPTSLRGIWRFYWPLANSMLVVWGGRTLLVAVIARAFDASLALAAWPAAWGFVLVVANASRMVQQVMIRNRGELSDTLLFAFAASVGGILSLLLLFVGLTPVGKIMIEAFVGGDEALVTSVMPVVLGTAIVPLLTAFQNALQGVLIGDGHTQPVNVATWVGTAILLTSAVIAVQLVKLPGATAAAIAMVLALVIENVWLGFKALGFHLRRTPDQYEPAGTQVGEKTI